MIIVIGGCGFIGSNFIRQWLKNTDELIINIDSLSTGYKETVVDLDINPSYRLIQLDIFYPEHCSIIASLRPRAIINFAVEKEFSKDTYYNTNATGVFRLLDSIYAIWDTMNYDERKMFRFIQISTDEVYGTLDLTSSSFNEKSLYCPNNPYAASKAAADQFVRSAFKSYGIPTNVVICSNNYGAHQLPKELIPSTIINAINGKLLPVKGQDSSDWLYVSDNCAAIQAIIDQGVPGEIYAIGEHSPKSNLDVVNAVCDALDKFRPLSGGATYKQQIIVETNMIESNNTRRSIDPSKIENLSWTAQETFESGIQKTVEWYLENQDWVSLVSSSPPRA